MDINTKLASEKIANFVEPDGYDVTEIRSGAISWDGVMYFVHTFWVFKFQGRSDVRLPF